MPTIIDVIDRLMSERNIGSYSELERLSGISNGSIGKWAKSNYEPSKKSLNRLAAYFDISVEELLVTPDLISVGVTGVRTWADNDFFTEEESANIKEHFTDLLFRYKNVVNHVCDARTGVHGDIDVDAIRNRVHSDIDALLHWVDLIPDYFFGKRKKPTALDGQPASERAERLVDKIIRLSPEDAQKALDYVEMLELKRNHQGS
ncbi:MAG: helix-turn-helix domain-containing protein [Oscillospiraceae bacterium]|jgi:transcriptional regulator with XRE-family HTH domain|nr:helix-turn-helix domain-containing protein [Oscillospiraceae bacterium]